MSSLEYIDSGVLAACDSMKIDADWIDRSFSRPCLRFYDWKCKSVTYGYFIDPERWLKIDVAKEAGFDIARRPTGGGMIFHYNDFSYTVAIPAGHPACSQQVLSNYHLINNALLEAVSSLCGLFSLHEQVSSSGSFSHFCMATPTKYDLIYRGKKLGGSAQRKTAKGIIHQGTLFLTSPNWEEMASILQFPEESVEAMKSSSIALLPITASQDEVSMLRCSLKKAFYESLERLLA